VCACGYVACGTVKTHLLLYCYDLGRTLLYIRLDPSHMRAATGYKKHGDPLFSSLQPSRPLTINPICVPHMPSWRLWLPRP
jgi:hypothetical protein